jgi:hypothetical protein
VGTAAMMIGFTGIKIPSDACSHSKEANIELKNKNVTTGQDHHSSR